MIESRILYIQEWQLPRFSQPYQANQVLRMPHQTSSMPDHHTGQGKGCWQTLLKHGFAVLRSLPCVGLHSSEPASSPPYSVDEEAAKFNNETKESVICINDDETAAYDYEDITKKLAKGKYQAFSDGSTTDSNEDEYSTDDDQELKQAMLLSIFYDRELEDWIRFRTPGATFHMGETSGVSINSSMSELSELEILEMIHF